MVKENPSFSIGIEEEYLLVDRETGDLAEAPEALMEACKADLDEQVSPEFLQCQIEIGTNVCADVGQAREDLIRLRSAVARHAADHGLAPIAAACHPFSDWKEQHHTDKDRYNDLRRDLAEALRDATGSDRFAHFGSQRGMFSRLGATPDQVRRLREDHAIYMVGDGRMNIAGLAKEDIPRLARAIAEVCGSDQSVG